MDNTCKICGCTDNDCSQCITKTGVPCYWATAEQDLCSACADLWCVKTLIQYMEHFSEQNEFGLCGMVSKLHFDLNLISSTESGLLKVWIHENAPEPKYLSHSNNKLAYSWKIGDVNARWYWLQSKLKELEIQDDLDFLHGFIGGIFKDM